MIEPDPSVAVTSRLTATAENPSSDFPALCTLHTIGEYGEATLRDSTVRGQGHSNFRLFLLAAAIAPKLVNGRKRPLSKPPNEALLTTAASSKVLRCIPHPAKAFTVRLASCSRDQGLVLRPACYHYRKPAGIVAATRSIQPGRSGTDGQTTNHQRMMVSHSSHRLLWPCIGPRGGSNVSKHCLALRRAIQHNLDRHLQVAFASPGEA
ncbi:hypothetical protein CERZMDRAFT_96765 [Cercospora zeae-maydis SCOH1-5]|uniref:Uncharacterized protein n=1 Tax=Cercospora zeae-maydis SCOH1-5 TaxID=717836 RepID=A0A6A6FHY0_9PEZI|nr:hypothetical protein CERZMDRAFT_96765 [Cercospora zeae-maydis SCOH1-5]